MGASVNVRGARDPHVLCAQLLRALTDAQEMPGEAPKFKSLSWHPDDEEKFGKFRLLAGEVQKVLALRGSQQMPALVKTRSGGKRVLGKYLSSKSRRLE
jgi:hypothetical protein